MRCQRITSVAVVLVGITLSACSVPSTHAVVSPPTPTATAPAAVATQSQSCAGLVHTWAQYQGRAQLHQLGADAMAISKDSLKVEATASRGGTLAGPVARWQADATALETGAQAAAANPPPACVNAADYGTAMQDYITAAKDYLASVSDFNSGSYGAAVTLVNAGSSAMQRGNSVIGHTIAAINALGG